MWRFRTVVGCVALVCLNTFRTRLNPLRVGHVSGLQAGFVQANVLVIVSIRFRLRAEASWSTMDREAGTKGTIAPGLAGAETCGGVMVRGPKSGNGTRSPVYYLDSAGLVPPRPRARELYGEMDPLAAGMLADGSLAADPGIGGSWHGGGGRWLLWPLRVVLWGTLLVIAFRGITAIVFNTASVPAVGGTGPQSATGQFPVTLAEAYAAEFGRVYLSFSPQNQGQREQALTAFVPASVSAANPDLGWNGTGQLNLQAEQVAGITVQDPRHAVVTLLVLINGQLMQLGVPVAASGRGVVVSGEPAWLSAPPQISPPPPALGRSDPVAQSQLMNELPAFFQAYANSDSAALNRFEVRGVSLTGLSGAVAFDSIGALHVPPGGATRQITVAVIWQLPDQSGSVAGNPGMTSKLEMKYSMSVVDLQSGKWYVKEIGATTEAVGAR
jgi:hypothetical protein